MEKCSCPLFADSQKHIFVNQINELKVGKQQILDAIRSDLIRHNIDNKITDIILYSRQNDVVNCLKTKSISHRISVYSFEQKKFTHKIKIAFKELSLDLKFEGCK